MPSLKSTTLDKDNESKNMYLDYLASDSDLQMLQIKLKEFITDDLINIAKKKSNDESWIIAYGYDDKPYCNNGGWSKTDPYPFITSDGKSLIDMYKLSNKDLESINNDNFITAFNKNKNLIKDIEHNENLLFALDKNKKLYKLSYPNVEEYDHIFIKHISSFNKRY